MDITEGWHNIEITRDQVVTAKYDGAQVLLAGTSGSMENPSQFMVWRQKGVKLDNITVSEPDAPVVDTSSYSESDTVEEVSFPSMVFFPHSYSGSSLVK